jgi:uncharacterized cupin superfamily protein
MSPMPKLDLEAVPQTNATGYPPPHSQAVAGRWYRRLAPASGLTKMGASHVVLKPGAWSSQRHWHSEEDELLVMLAGVAVLVEDGGETVIRPGDVCAWPAGVRNGHHLQNRSREDCVFVAISAGDGERDSGEYPDLDLVFDPEGYARRDGTRYPSQRPA